MEEFGWDAIAWQRLFIGALRACFQSGFRFRGLFILSLIFLSACFSGKSPGPPVQQFDTESIKNQKVREEVNYGRNLIARTAEYLGPEGRVNKYAKNRMNCQNCHLDAGSKIYGNHFLKSHSIYPMYRPREGRVLTLADRVNNCIVRNLSGVPIPYNSREMRAILAYIRWLGTGTKVDDIDSDTRLGPITLMKRAASPNRGKFVFEKHCVSCHGVSGQGKSTPDGKSLVYPPLWGQQSYQKGTSMHLLSKFARFVKYNMPFGLVGNDPVLTDEEAWDVAAFVNDDSIHPRPPAQELNDYPFFEEKPFDYSFGPFADPFPASQHKFGPFLEIIQYYEKNKKNPHK